MSNVPPIRPNAPTPRSQPAAPVVYQGVDPQPEKTSPVVYVVIGVAALVALGGGGGLLAWLLMSKKPVEPAPAPVAVQQAPVAPPASRRAAVVLPGPAVAVDAEGMIALAATDKAEADKAYKDRTIDVTGDVLGIKTDVLLREFVALSGGVERTLGVRCYFKEENRFQAAEISQGFHVTIRGRYEVDPAEPNLVLRDCAVIKSAAPQ
ncbi:MAG TPA: hypothetical protein VF796_10700 [Humisphaera sp.]